jgi:hypothetical protein
LKLSWTNYWNGKKKRTSPGDGGEIADITRAVHTVVLMFTSLARDTLRADQINNIPKLMRLPNKLITKLRFMFASPDNQCMLSGQSLNMTRRVVFD